RDRIGEKPLYYAFVNGGIAFASEIKGLLSIPDLDRTPDEEAITCFLVYETPPAPLTFFKKIRAVEPATLMVWKDACVTKTRRYWKVNFSRTRDRWTWEDALER